MEMSKLERHTHIAHIAVTWAKAAVAFALTALAVWVMFGGLR
jgi:hypothetical protein